VPDNTVVKEALQLFTRLQELKKAYYKKINQSPPSFTAEQWEQHNEQGIFLLQFCQPVLDDDICKELVGEICNLLAANKPAKKEQIEKIRDYLCKMSSDFFTEIINQEHQVIDPPSSFSEEDCALLNIVVRQTLRPFLEKYIDSLPREVGGEKWQRNYCPVCGEKANFSYLRQEDGKRVLICPFCGQEWLYRYLACSWCGNDDHKAISYFEAVEMPGYEVYLCDRCHRYLKTFNTKKGIGHDDWVLEDVKTINLDLIAQKKGYTGYSSQAH